MIGQGKKKDKSMKCRKCLKGGHLDVHCLEEVQIQYACHICESTNLDHDIFNCPYLEKKCNNCGMFGHVE